MSSESFSVGDAAEEDFFLQLLEGPSETEQVSVANLVPVKAPSPQANRFTTFVSAPIAISAPLQVPQIGLAAWSTTKAGYPVPFARSALFRVGEAREREEWIWKENIPMPAAKGIELVYTGPRLNQRHALVFQALAEATQGATSDLVISHGEVLRRMGVNYSTVEAHAWLWKHLKDLVDARIAVRTQRGRYFGGLIHGIEQDDRTGMLSIALDNKLAGLFTNEIIITKASERASLGNGQLTQWLHSYLSSHYKCYPVAVSELYRLCGFDREMKKFRYSLKASMKVLSEGENPLITEWQIDVKDNLVFKKRSTRVVMLDSDRPKVLKSAGSMGSASFADKRAWAQRAKVAL